MTDVYVVRAEYAIMPEKMMEPVTVHLSEESANTRAAEHLKAMLLIELSEGEVTAENWRLVQKELHRNEWEATGGAPDLNFGVTLTRTELLP